MNILKEVCVESFLQAKRSDSLGADRIELCDNLELDGTTPSFGTIKIAYDSLGATIFPIIRPRGGNFIYSEEEIKIMEIDIEKCNEIGIKGIVIGALDHKNNIDQKTIKRLVNKAQGMEVTFHMAFDEIEDKKSALHTLIKLRVDRVLTKGGNNKAMDNLESLKELVDYADGRITILAGGSVNRDNYMDIVRETGVSEVHGRRIV